MNDGSVVRNPQELAALFRDQGVVIVEADYLAPPGESSQSSVYRVQAVANTLNSIGFTEQATKLLNCDGGLVEFVVKVASTGNQTWLAREAKILHKLHEAGVKSVPTMLVPTPGPDEAKLSFLPLSLIEGQNLHHTFIRTEGGPLPQTVLDLSTFARSLWHSLIELHNAGVAHRDYRLSNVMVAESEENRCWEQTTTIDFGRAYHKSIPLRDDDGAPAQSSAINTRCWRVPNRTRDPKQRNLETEAAIDIYMWACNVHMIFTGRPLLADIDEYDWENPSDDERTEQLSNKIIDAIETIDADANLKAALLIALQHNPAERKPESITQLLKATTDQKNPVKTLTLDTTTKQRNLKKVSTLATLIILLLLSGVAFRTWRSPPSDSDPAGPQTVTTSPVTGEPEPDVTFALQDLMEECTIPVAELPFTQLETIRLDPESPLSANGECENFAMTININDEEQTVSSWEEVDFTACISNTDPDLRNFELEFTTQTDETIRLTPGLAVGGIGGDAEDRVYPLLNPEQGQTLTVRAYDGHTAPNDNGWLGTCADRKNSININWLP